MNIEANRQATGPRVLDDVRVLDFSAIVAGAYCTRLMADLGADVLKVEPPGGEMIRHVAPMRGETSTVFSALNSGKRCIALDLKQPEVVQLVKRLVRDYDVVVENYSPGVMHRLGLDYEALSAENPALIMCSISGYGQTGPGSRRPAFAPIVQAMSGFDMVTLDNQPGLDRPLNMGLPVADTTASQQAFGAITAALYYRTRTGTGQYIDIAMLDSLLATMHRDFQAAFHPGRIDRIYGPVATADGFVMMMPFSESQFTSLCRAIGKDALIDDARFANLRKRLEHYNDLMAVVEAWSSDRPTDDVVAAMHEAHVPCAPYRDIPTAVADAQIEHRGMLTQVVDAAGPLDVPNSPYLFSATQAAVRPDVARVGEHTRAVLLDELGLDDKRIAALTASKAIELGDG